MKIAQEFDGGAVGSTSIDSAASKNDSNDSLKSIEAVEALSKAKEAIILNKSKHFISFLFYYVHLTQTIQTINGIFLSKWKFVLV